MILTEAVAGAHRAQDALENAAVREQLRLLATLKRDILAALADSTGFRRFHLYSILQVIDQQVRAAKSAASSVAYGRVAAAWRAGGGVAELAVGLDVQGIHGLSAQLLAASQDLAQDRVRGVYSELGSTLKQAVRRAVLGIDDPQQAIQRVAKVIRNPKTFGTAKDRAEVIVRSEINRTYSVATNARLLQAEERLGAGKVQKWWLTARDARVRPTHADAGKRYAIGGRPGPIPLKQPFLVGKDRLMFPLDPRGSAAECANCRCRMVAMVTP